jgi:hypothetical protein
MNGLNGNLWKKMIGSTSIRNAVQNFTSQMSRRKAFRAALVRAYTICGHTYYPDWAAYFLDRDFQDLGSGRLRTCYLEGSNCPTPVELGKLWADRTLVPWLSAQTMQRMVAELVKVADGFLRRLEAELCAERELRTVSACKETVEG